MRVTVRVSGPDGTSPLDANMPSKKNGAVSIADAARLDSRPRFSHTGPPMSAADARSLLLRGLVTAALGAVIVAGGVYQGELGAELERSLIDDLGVAPAKQRSAVAPAPAPAPDALATRNSQNPTRMARDVTIVVTSEGSPVSRYDLTVDRGKPSGSNTILRTRVDEGRGRLPVIALLPGRYTLHVVADAGGAALAFDVDDGPNEPISVSLAPFGTVRGSLVDARSHRPLQAELEFRVIPKDARTGRSLTSSYLSSITHKVSTDEHGEFTLRKIEPGALGLQLRDPMTERPIRIMQRDESGALTHGSGYVGELLAGEELDLGVVRGKLGYDYYR
jgi:hypothetical protein